MFYLDHYKHVLSFPPAVLIPWGLSIQILLQNNRNAYSMYSHELRPQLIRFGQSDEYKHEQILETVASKFSYTTE